MINGERVHDLAVEHDVQLDQLALLVALQLVVEAGITAGARFQRIEKVVDDLVKRQLIMDIDAVRVDVFHILKYAAPLLAKVHNIAHIFLRRVDMGVRNRFFGLRDQRRVGIIGRVVDGDHFAVGLRDMVNDARRGCDDVQIVFALQPLLDDLHMQKPQEAAAETEAQRDGGLRLKGERRIVELQFLQRVPQVRVFRAVRRINAAEHHGLYRAVARQRLLRGVVRAA